MADYVPEGTYARARRMARESQPRQETTMGQYDQWNPVLHSVLREDRSGPPEGIAHAWYKTTMQDQYKNALFTCNCVANVTGEERQVRAHVLEYLIESQFAGTVSVGATGFVPVEEPKTEPTAESLFREFMKSVRKELE